MKKILVLLAVTVTFFSCCSKDESKTLSPTDDSRAFVTLTDAVPDAILEIRYYGTYNFVGARIDGYLQPTALLTRQAADSLRAVSDDLMAQGYRLKSTTPTVPSVPSTTLCVGPPTWPTPP